MKRSEFVLRFSALSEKCEANFFAIGGLSTIVKVDNLIDKFFASIEYGTKADIILSTDTSRNSQESRKRPKMKI